MFPSPIYETFLLQDISETHLSYKSLPYDFFESFIINYTYVKASLVVHMVKNLPAMQETRVQSLGQEDPLEEGLATHSRIFAWRSPWPEEPGGL